MALNAQKRTAFIVALLLAGSTTFAEDQQKPEINFNGFFDAYYSYNFNHPRMVTLASNTSVSTAGLPAANNTYRYYDTFHNQMTISLAEFSVQAKYQEVSLLTDFDFGPFADLNSPVDEISKHIGQAVLTYKPAGSAFTFDAGKMYTNVGLETAKSKDNYNYSKSVLFSYGMPFWHSGVRFGYDAIPEKLQTSLYVYNSWNSLYDNNESKTLGVQLKYTPSSAVTVIYNFLGGPERADTEADLKTVHELNATWVVNDTWILAADLLTGKEEKALVSNTKAAEWSGALLLAKYQLTEKSYLSPRFEIYHDQDGYTLGGGDQTVQTATLTYGKSLTRGLEFRAEARADKSNQKTFVAEGGTTKDSQTTLLAALLFNF